LRKIKKKEITQRNEQRTEEILEKVEEEKVEDGWKTVGRERTDCKQRENMQRNLRANKCFQAK
jgi:hypothetical protein